MSIPQLGRASHHRLLLLSVLCVATGCDISHKPSAIIKHPSVYDRNVITAVEYILPAKEMPDGEHAELDPWIRQMRGKRSAEVKQFLVERWSTIKNPALVELRDRLLEFQPVSILVHKGQGWLTLQLPNAQPGSGDIWYLPAPQDDVDWPAKLQEVGMQDHPVLAEFIQHFAGLRESIPNAAGNFLDRSEFETFPLPGYKPTDINGLPEWQGALIIYHACTGNHLVLHPSGKCAWWWFAEHEVAESHPDLESFIRAFTKFSREYSFPFDGYDPGPEYRRK